ncbi:MAG: ComEC/Rec2 family competence protein [Bacteroidetes bacterium]|nr:ComEC/Rec2 family competence protein [Bacteroidota bacterium]
MIGLLVMGTLLLADVWGNGFGLAAATGGLALVGGVLGWLLQQRGWYVVAVGALLCAAVAGLYGIAYHTRPDNVMHLGEDVLSAPLTMQAEQTRELRKTRFAYYTWVQLHTRLADGTWQPLSGEVVAYLPRAAGQQPDDWLVGSRWVMTGRLTALPDTNGYQQYLHRKGITHKLQVRSFQSLPGGGMMLPFARTQNKLAHKLDDVLPAEVAPLGRALLLGQQSDLNRELREQFALSGVAHILALSGHHLSMLALLVGWLLRFLPMGKWLWPQRVLILGLMIFYAAVTGFSPSVVRAVFMAAALMLGYSLLRPVSMVNVIAFCFTVQVLTDVRLLYSMSLQLSYAAVFGLVTLGDALNRLFAPRYWLVRHGWGLIAASLAAQVATLPLVLLHFGDFPLYFLLANLVLLPLLVLLMPVGLALLLFFWLPGVGEVLAWCFTQGIVFMQAFTVWVASLPGTGALQLHLTEPQAWLLALALAAGTAVLWRWIQRRQTGQMPVLAGAVV